MKRSNSLSKADNKYSKLGSKLNMKVKDISNKENIYSSKKALPQVKQLSLQPKIGNKNKNLNYIEIDYNKPLKPISKNVVQKDPFSPKGVNFNQAKSPTAQIKPRQINSFNKKTESLLMSPKKPSDKYNKIKTSDPFAVGKKHKTNFGYVYSAGGIPCRIEHGSVRLKLKWDITPDSKFQNIII
jgi:hypothetical protein